MSASDFKVKMEKHNDMPCEGKDCICQKWVYKSQKDVCQTVFVDPRGRVCIGHMRKDGSGDELTTWKALDSPPYINYLPAWRDHHQQVKKATISWKFLKQQMDWYMRDYYHKQSDPPLPDICVVYKCDLCHEEHTFDSKIWGQRFY